MNTAEVVERSWRQPLVVGHRGAAGYLPENTVASFEGAIDRGADGVECDVHVSADGELAVIHDQSLERTTRLTGRVKDTPMSVLRAVGVPTLSEFLAITKDRALSVVEIKEGDGVAPKVVDLLRACGMVDQTVLFSFEAEYLRQAKQIEPALFCALLSPSLPTLEGFPFDAVSIAYSAVTEAFVRQARERRLPVFVWTVPPGSETERMRNLKVNFIITNHP